MYKLSVVIPCYKATQTIAQTLHSIAMQSIVDDVEVIIVNDCDGLDYSCILCKFDMHQSFIRRDKNGGCGAARNTGILAATAPYIIFIDADDQFSNPLALEILYNTIRKQKADVVSAAFESEMRFADDEYQKFAGVAIKKIERSPVWCHSKIYSRQYLLDNNLFFKESLRINEDVEFHQILIDIGAKIVEIPTPLYMWRDNPKSVTHESLYNNKEWFVRAVTEYLRDCAERGLTGEVVKRRVLQNLTVMYDYANITADDVPEKLSDYLAVCREYWKLAAPIVADVSDEEITEVFLTVMKQQMNVIPTITFTDFLDMIRN